MDAPLPPKTPVIEASLAQEPPRTWIALKAGGASQSLARRPTLCLEVAPFARLSVEACGTGSGFLHNDSQTSLTHFHLKYQFWHTRLEGSGSTRNWLQAFGHFGFAEMQRGADRLGFTFDEARDAVETAGPEVGASLRLLSPLPYGFHAQLTLQATLAYLPHAPELIPSPSGGKLSPFQPEFQFTVGFGF